MAKNTGKPSEEIFDEAWARLGKRAFVLPLVDASAATGRNRRVVDIPAQPSDRIVTYNGETFYAEVKSTIDPRNFPFRLLRKNQKAFARQILAAGGRYEVYLHALATDTWYCIPYQVILDTKASSIPYTNLADFVWEQPCLLT